MGKKQKQEQSAPRSREEKFGDILELRRRAREVKRHVIVMRTFGVLIIILVVIIAIAYAISYFYDKYGSFTVRVSKYDMINQGITLSETPEFYRSNAVLNADIVYDMTNISGEDIPDNVDMVNGSHNGSDYIAYTFYMINSGSDTISYTGEMVLQNVTRNVDEAIRVAVYQNGEKKVYGKTKSNGKGKEQDCDAEFSSATQVMNCRRDKFAAGQKDKYTVVIWLEGNDPDCTDAIIGGTLKLEMNFKITEGT